MSFAARLLLWAAALVAAADCQTAAAGSFAVGNQSAAAGAATNGPASSHEQRAGSRQQEESMSAKTEARRARMSRGRRGDCLDDLLDSLLFFFCSLGNAIASCVASCLPALALVGLGLCLARPLAGQDADFLGGSPPAEEAVRYLPDGNGRIVVSDPLDFSRVPALDCDDPSSLLYTYRPNLFGIDVPDEWDFYNLVNTDRPDFTDATYSVGEGVTIIETGYTFRRAFDHATDTVQSRRSLPEALVRYGLTNEFEVRLKWNGYVMSDLHDRSTGIHQQLFGGDDLITSIKYEVWQQNGALPMLTFLTGSTLPTGTNGISSNQTQPFANFVAGWGFRRWLYLKLSTGIDWQKTSVSTLFGGGSEPTGPIVVFLRDNINVYHFSASLLYQALPRVGGFAELFGFAQTGGADNRGAVYFDTGLFLYATTNVQFDVRYGLRLSDRVDELFAGAGYSVRY
jgi:hypothetical protein